VTGFFKRGDGLEGRLRADRPQPSDEFVSRIEARVSETRPRYRTSFRFAVPAALTIAMISALAAVGGVSYAASNVVSAASTVAKVFVPAKEPKPAASSKRTSGGDQYEDGYEWGDKDHNHEGKPVISKGGKGDDKGGKDNSKGGKDSKGNKRGDFTPPLIAQVQGKTATVATSFTIDEQARLSISVLDTKTGKQLLINQTKSKVGKTLGGTAVKSIDYRVLVPRTIPLKLALPANLLKPGAKYAIRVIARDPDGNKSKLVIPFSG
jgi:hypothetical protein